MKNGVGIRLILSLLVIGPLLSQESDSEPFIARLKYRGGGDWYNDPSALPNLARFMSQETGVQMPLRESQVSAGEESLFSFPLLFMTGHGRISMSDREIRQLRRYLLSGGFLYADDDYGMDSYFRSLMERVFPEYSLMELPFYHGIYSIHFHFEHGLPKIHEHDDKAPRGYGIFDSNGRMMVFYTVETNISDGWADAQVHHDPPETRRKALEMGANIVLWALMH